MSDLALEAANARLDGIIATIPDVDDRSYIKRTLDATTGWSPAFLALIAEECAAFDRPTTFEWAAPALSAEITVHMGGYEWSCFKVSHSLLSSEWEVGPSEGGRPAQVSERPTEVRSCSDAFAWIAERTGSSIERTKLSSGASLQAVIGDNVRRLRLERGWTVEQLNAKLTKRLGFASHFPASRGAEEGKLEVGTATIEAYATIFEVDATEIIGRHKAES